LPRESGNNRRDRVFRSYSASCSCIREPDRRVGFGEYDLRGSARPEHPRAKRRVAHDDAAQLAAANPEDSTCRRHSAFLSTARNRFPRRWAWSRASRACWRTGRAPWPATGKSPTLIRLPFVALLAGATLGADVLLYVGGGAGNDIGSRITL